MIKRKGKGNTREGNQGRERGRKVQKEKAQVQVWLLHSKKLQFPALLPIPENDSPLALAKPWCQTRDNG